MASAPISTSRPRAPVEPRPAGPAEPSAREVAPAPPGAPVPSPTDPPERPSTPVVADVRRRVGATSAGLQQRLESELRSPAAPRRGDDPPGIPGERAVGKLRGDGPPQRSAFREGMVGEAAYQRALGAYERTVPTTSPSRPLLEEAERQGVPVAVLPDAEYARQHPGTTGATRPDGTVVIPSSALDSPPGALQHELVHGILRKANAFNPREPAFLRQARLGALFGRMGLDPADGLRLAKLSQGWPDAITGGQVQARVTRALGDREQKGLPPLTPDQKERLYELAAKPEAALTLHRDVERAATLPPAEQPAALASLLAKWKQYPQLPRPGVLGGSPAEQLARLQAILGPLTVESPELLALGTAR